MSINAIIVDDEQHAIDSFIKIAGMAHPDLQVIAAYTRPEAMLKHLHEGSLPDLLFLDVEMSPYSGFRLLEILQERSVTPLPFDVIFLTAYDQYAIKAFRYNALDYLLKPLLEDELRNTVNRWMQKKHKQLHPVQWGQLSHYLNRAETVPDRMAIPTLEGYEIVLFEEIVRCAADRNYTHIVMQNRQSHTVCRTLKEVESVLIDHDFLRVHHSHVIHPRFVTKILKADGGTVEMTDGTQIRITRNKEEYLEKIFFSIKKL
ncbi:LytTR family DNA-binding domain-containing protein [Fulvivirgaceae bacterium PWU5]|uniref:LytTR family DNA-binding domain-containing protein n=1 Tax=Dawidia cretensis TaxID=2782350 RepID=A0AAP2DX81_9BACT|nr:LytTR family DNA-binding domain-containing protein [Dawidia cretensis]MBT1707389.1 LytTR family DNA-binding domain-containing protein [Dawidia cretensis]